MIKNLEKVNPAKRKQIQKGRNSARHHKYKVNKTVCKAEVERDRA